MNQEARIIGKKEFRDAAHGVTLIILAVTYVFSRLFPNPVLVLGVEIMALLTLVETLFLARGITRIISFVLLGLGAGMLYLSNASVLTWLNGFGQNAGLITLFVLVPQLAIPLRCRRYMHAVADFYRTKINNNNRMYLYSMLLTHFFGVILSVGSVAIVYNLVKEKIDADNQPVVLKAINRGFAACIMWSPYFAAMALVLSKIEVSWASVAMINIPLAVIALAGGFLLDFRPQKNNKVNIGVNLKPENRKILNTMILTGLGLTLSMFVMEWITGISMVLIVCLAATIFPFLWSFLPGNKVVYRQGLRNYFWNNLPLLRGEVVLFLSAGFFASAIANSDFSTYILTLFEAISGHGQMVTELAILGIVVVLAVVGIHPVVSVSVLAGSLTPALVGLSPATLAATFLMSWAVANITSPFTAVNMMLGGLSGRSLIDISLRWNLLYTVCMGLLLSYILNNVY